VTDFIIDCEVVAWDTKENKILPFQTLTHRKRKDVQQHDITINVCLYAFDILYLNGKSYLNEPLATRRQTLFDTFHVVKGEFAFAEHRDTGDETEVQEFMDYAVKNQCEGLMIKSLEVDAHYVPAKRNWLKLKKDYLAGVGDTLDLVPIGAYYGKGKRTGM
jgi:DNA ligase-1